MRTTNFICRKTMFLILVFNVALTSFMIAQDGFGGKATGGAGGTPVTATNASNFTTYATSSSPYIITVSGTIILTGNVNVNSNKTIQGADTNATIRGDLKITSGVTNVIIQNLNITNPTGVGDGDGVTISSGAKRIFITHCNFIDCADGMCDITNQADSVTVSWCRFRYVSQTTHRYVNLIGSSDSAPDLGYLHVTFHHNWYDQLCNERLPSVRFGRVHVYNNYFNSDSALYCVRTRLYAECLVENNYFEHVQNPWELALSKASGTITGKLHAANNNINYLDTTNGIIWVDEWYEDTYIISKLIPGNDTVFTPSYSYTPDDYQIVKNRVMAGAGNTTTYTITSSAGANGSITPIGVTYVRYGFSQSYTITPAEGYDVSDLVVDGGSVGPALSYTFSTVSANHTISASFIVSENTSVGVNSGWNLVSVPRVQTDYNVTEVFPDAFGGVVYAFVPGSGYAPVSTLELGMGYWLFYQNPATVTISGSVPGSIIFDAAAGWNIIGSSDMTVEVSSLVLSGGAVIMGDVGYIFVPGSGYSPVTAINPGEGAWIYVTADCEITIP